MLRQRFLPSLVPALQRQHLSCQERASERALFPEENPLTQAEFQLLSPLKIISTSPSRLQDGLSPSPSY